LLTVVGSTQGSSINTVNHQGFIRNYKGHVDATSSYRIEDSLDKPVCASFQTTANQIGDAQYPQLNASAGDYIQGTYLENGHISLPQNSASKTGMTYWFGTTKTDIPTLAEVLKWGNSSDSNSSDGVLLATAPFDDGVCVEVNGSPISQQRVAANGGTPPGPCKSTFKIPETAAADSTYTVYWVWNFSGNTGKTDPEPVEWYTSCIDIKIVGGSDTSAAKSNLSSRSVPKVPKIRGRTPKL
jgi:hypothetical protein